MNRVKVAIIGLLVVLALSGVALAAFLYMKGAEVEQNSKFSREVNDALIRSCEKNGNPLREVVRGIIEDEIKQSKEADLTKFFPQFPPSELEKLVKKQNRQRHSRMQEIKPLNCDDQYPEPKG